MDTLPSQVVCDWQPDIACVGEDLSAGAHGGKTHLSPVDACLVGLQGVAEHGRAEHEARQGPAQSKVRLLLLPGVVFARPGILQTVQADSWFVQGSIKSSIVYTTLLRTFICCLCWLLLLQSLADLYGCASMAPQSPICCPQCDAATHPCRLPLGTVMLPSQHQPLQQSWCRAKSSGCTLCTQSSP